MDGFLKRVLLATDGSGDAALASRAALDLSGKADAQLHVVHAWNSVASARLEAYIHSHMKNEAKELLAAQVERLEGEGKPVADTHLVEGPEVDEILDVAEEIGADLIVLGSRGHGLVERLVMGSVSEGVVHHTSCPVLVVRGGERAWPPERVIIADDGSETSRDAGDLAARIGSLVGATGFLLRAYPELPDVDPEGRRSDARLADDELRREENLLRQRATEVEEHLGKHPKIRLAAGEATARLLEAAEEGNAERTLIAVGSRGLGTMQRMRFGSVSTKVLRAARGPVLVYPRPQESDEVPE